MLAPHGADGSHGSELVGGERGTDVPAHIEQALPGGVSASARARDLLAPLRPRLGATLHDELVLLVSELVTNSVRHAGVDERGWIDLRVDASEQAVRAEVRDPGVGFDPHVREPDPREPGGWGLFLVDQLSERWGRLADGAGVWFELERAPAAYGAGA